MVDSINKWAQGIILAIIISIVLQMIIPENKNKKYIKTIMGIYVLFCIIHPVTGNTIKLDNYDLNQYVAINETQNKQDEIYDSNVRELFNDKISDSIKNDLNTIGYDSRKIRVSSNEEYDITQITIEEVQEYKSENQIVNNIEISIKDKPARGMPISEKEKIKNMISEKYSVNKENIFIN